MRSLPLFHRVAGKPVIVLGEGEAAGPFDQPPLGLGRLALPQHDHRLAGDAVKERQRPHQSSQSGTRSAAVISSGRMRSATTANRSPSTMTSATKPRLL